MYMYELASQAPGLMMLKGPMLGVMRAFPVELASQMWVGCLVKAPPRPKPMAMKKGEHGKAQIRREG